MPTKKTDNNPQTPGSPPRRKSNRTRGLEPGTVEPDTVDVSSLGKPQGARSPEPSGFGARSTAHVAALCALQARLSRAASWSSGPRSTPVVPPVPPRSSTQDRWSCAPQ